MKQQIISGLKKKLLIAELPEGSNRLSVFNDEKPYLSYFKGYDTRRFYLPGKCVLIGKLTDITEEQFDQWVDSDNDIEQYFDYEYGNYTLDFAKESFLSALEANGICFENKIKPHESGYDFNRLSEKFLYEKDLKSWQEAQEKVYNINRCWIFEII